MTHLDSWIAHPLAWLAGGAFALYLIARLITQRNEILALCTSLVFIAALSAQVALGIRMGRNPVGTSLIWGTLAPGGAMLRATPGAVIIGGIALSLGLGSAIYSGRYLALDKRYTTYYPLLLLLICGLLGMILSEDLFSLYLFCELMSIAAYVLVAFRRQTDTAIEAGFKYLMLGSVGTLTLLMGIALIYRQTGSVALIQPKASTGVWGRAGLASLWVGLSIKSALVPLHTWLPDAHGRAPSSVSALLSGIVIQSAFYVQIKASLGLGLPAQQLGLLLIGYALLNMTLSNVMALVQTHVKRLLAYSTIAQMGYVMLGIGIGLRYGIPEAMQAGFFVLLVHAAMKALAFLSKGVCHFYAHVTTIEQLRGIARRMPLPAVTLSLALGGLAGIPPLAGFTSKWFLLTHTLRAGDLVAYIAVGLFLLNTLAALGYYLPLIVTLFVPQNNTEEEKIPISPWMTVPLIALSSLVLGIGLYPGPWWELIAWALEYGL